MGSYFAEHGVKFLADKLATVVGNYGLGRAVLKHDVLVKFAGYGGGGSFS